MKTSKRIPKTIRGTFKLLEAERVNHIELTTFNKEQFNERFRREYSLLYKKIVLKRIFRRFNILPYNNKVAFKSFDYENGRWIGTFTEPWDTQFDVKRVLKKDFTGLDILEEYATPDFMFENPKRMRGN